MIFFLATSRRDVTGMMISEGNHPQRALFQLFSAVCRLLDVVLQPEKGTIRCHQTWLAPKSLNYIYIQLFIIIL